MELYCSMDERDPEVFLANENKTKWVTLITLLTMIVEIIVGYWSGSMALLADGWHMASHTLALFLSLIVYFLYRHPGFRSSFTFGGGKILSLGGYTSSLFLVLIALSMIYESVTRFFDERTILYNEAIWVASIGLVVNLICAMIMHQSGHGHDHDHDHGHGHSHAHTEHQHGAHCQHSHHSDVVRHDHPLDHNHQSAYIHILTDALTSVLAIVALLLGRWQGWSWLDPAVGILGGVVVFKWSLGLIRQSGKDLLDAHDTTINRQSLVKELEKDGSKVIDIHLWKVAPGQVGCEIIIKRNESQNASDYREKIKKHFSIHHLIIEVV
jgi:cation diffusion facilitator family transporter